MQSNQHPRQVFARPSTSAGRMATGLVALHALFLLFFFMAASSGQGGGEEFFDNLQLAIPVMLAGVFGIAAGVTAALAIVLKHERSIFDWLTVLLGLFIAFFIFGEVLSSH